MEGIVAVVAAEAAEDCERVLGVLEETITNWGRVRRAAKGKLRSVVCRKSVVERENERASPGGMTTLPTARSGVMRRGIGQRN